MDTAEDILAHYGVKGMKWGRRKGDGPVDVIVTTAPGKKAKASGGTGKPATADAVSAIAARQQAKKSGVQSLSNAELKKVNERLNLEQNFNRLTASDVSAGKKFIKLLLDDKVGKELDRFTSEDDNKRNQSIGRQVLKAKTEVSAKIKAG